MSDLTAAVEAEYVPTLVERMAEAIPAELTATPHVGIGGARRLKIAKAVLAVVEAELAAARADERAKTAEDIARAMEAAPVPPGHQSRPTSCGAASEGSPWPR